MGSPPDAGWHPDPTGRHEQRYWDGTEWSEHVVVEGVVVSDPLPDLSPPPGPERPPAVVPDEPTGPSTGKRLWLYFTEQDEAGARRKAQRANMQARSFERQASKQEKRALKMSKKIGRGGRRSAKASQTAMGLRDAAERKRNGE